MRSLHDFKPFEFVRGIGNQRPPYVLVTLDGHYLSSRLYLDASSRAKQPINCSIKKQVNCHFRKILTIFLYTVTIKRDLKKIWIKNYTDGANVQEQGNFKTTSRTYGTFSSRLNNTWNVAFLNVVRGRATKEVSTKEWPSVYRLVRSSLLKHAWKTNRCIRQSDTANLYIARFPTIL